MLKNGCLANEMAESPYTACILSVSGWKLSGGDGVEFSEQCIRLISARLTFKLNKIRNLTLC